MQLALKRGDDADADLRTWVQCYTGSVRKAHKMFKKVDRKTASDVEGCRATNLVAEAGEIAVSTILDSTLCLLSKQIVKSSFHEKRVLCCVMRINCKGWS